MSGEDERVRVSFTDDETREIMGISAAVEDCLRAAGQELPPDPIRALLMAGRMWFSIYADACSAAVCEPHDGVVH